MVSRLENEPNISELHAESICGLIGELNFQDRDQILSQSSSEVRDLIRCQSEQRKLLPDLGQ